MMVGELLLMGYAVFAAVLIAAREGILDGLPRPVELEAFIAAAGPGRA